MDIFLSTNDRKEIIKLPVNPQQIRIGYPHKNETFEAVDGDIKLIGLDGLRNIQLESFFPNHKYKFDKNKFENPPGYYVNMLLKWKRARIPIRLLITKSSISYNNLFSIENFDYGVQDGSGDIHYSISLEEFKQIVLTTKKV